MVDERYNHRLPCGSRSSAQILARPDRSGRARQVAETVIDKSEVAVLADGERGKRDESPYFTGRVVGNRDLGYLAPRPCVLVAAEGLHTVPWDGSFPQHNMVVRSGCSENLPSLRWNTVGVSGRGAPSIRG